MFNKLKYMARMDEAGGGEGTDAGGSGGAPAATAAPTGIPADYETVKQTLSQTSNAYQGLQKELEGLRPSIELAKRMESVFNKPEVEKPRFSEGISLANVTEAAQEALRSGDLSREETAALRQEMQSLVERNNRLDYDSATLEFNEKWVDTFNDPKDLSNALDVVGQMRPDLVRELEGYTSQGKVPPVEYVRKVDSVIEKIVLAEMLNPSSALGRSIQSKLSQKAKLKESSVMDGDGYSANGKSNDSFISISYS